VEYLAKITIILFFLTGILKTVSRLVFSKLARSGKFLRIRRIKPKQPFGGGLSAQGVQ
jgi:hypothetical protein